MNAADALLAQTADAYDELDSRALALCGLALLEDAARVSEAIEAFRAARALTRAEGIVARVLRLFDALAVSDEAGILAAVRPAAAGETSPRSPPPRDHGPGNGRTQMPPDSTPPQPPFGTANSGPASAPAGASEVELYKLGSSDPTSCSRRRSSALIRPATVDRCSATSRSTSENAWMTSLPSSNHNVRRARKRTSLARISSHSVDAASWAPESSCAGARPTRRVIASSTSMIKRAPWSSSLRRSSIEAR